MLWRSRKWRRLLNLIDHLPRACHTRAAMANDDEHVGMILEAQEKNPELDQGSSVPLHDYGTVEERLDRLIDVSQSMIAAIVASAGGKPPRVRPVERPETAYERVKHRRQMQQYGDIVARVMHRGPAPSVDSP